MKSDMKYWREEKEYIFVDLTALRQTIRRAELSNAFKTNVRGKDIE